MGDRSEKPQGGIGEGDGDSGQGTSKKFPIRPNLPRLFSAICERF